MSRVNDLFLLSCHIIKHTEYSSNSEDTKVIILYILEFDYKYMTAFKMRHFHSGKAEFVSEMIANWKL